MQYPLREKIGDPSLLVGRSSSFQNFGKWLRYIPKSLGKSRVIPSFVRTCLARRYDRREPLCNAYSISFGVKTGPWSPFTETSRKKNLVPRFCDQLLSFLCLAIHFLSGKRWKLGQNPSFFGRNTCLRDLFHQTSCQRCWFIIQWSTKRQSRFNVDNGLYSPTPLCGCFWPADSGDAGWISESGAVRLSRSTLPNQPDWKLARQLSFCRGIEDRPDVGHWLLCRLAD